MHRTVLLGLLLSASALAAHAAHRPTARTAAETEARNEVAVPSLTAQAHAALRISSFLANVLALSTVQLQAVEAFTKAERLALLLAATADDVTQARHDYRLAVHRVLDARQLTAYVALCQQLAGTAQALDGTELAQR